MSAEEYEVIEEEDEIPHADERWLISYADMMTLLFGLFVLLYSTRFEVIQNSISNKFAAEKPPEKDTSRKTKSAEDPDPKSYEKIKTQLAETQNKYLQTQAELEKSQAQFLQSQTALENLKKTVQSESEKSSNQVKALKEESNRLAAQLNTVGGSPTAPIRPQEVTPAPPAVATLPSTTVGNVGPGTGTGAGSAPPFHVSSKFGDGTVLEEDISQVSPTSITLSKPPPLSFAGLFNMTLTHKGQTIELKVRADYDNDGHMSRNLEIWSISTTDRILLEKWLKH